MSSGRRPPDVRKVRTEEIKEEKTLPIAGWLLVLNGKHKGEDFRLREGKNTVGTDPSAEVRLDEPHISLKHANITVKRASENTGGYSVIDLDSTNGTFLNESKEKIGREELVDNDTITFGTTKCKFKCV
jgi:DNA segregation ATPase FtsK/SpoIIIE, S-DNA-T family